MATFEEIKAQALEILKQITASPKPSYNIDGQQISWGAYLKQLQTTIEFCDKKIAEDSGPFEIHSRGYT